jgi:hypothetical protein
MTSITSGSKPIQQVSRTEAPQAKVEIKQPERVPDDTYVPPPAGSSTTLPPSASVSARVISQLKPDGLSSDYSKTTPAYVDGSGFCGPTAMLIAAKALGFKPGTSTNAQAIVNLAQAGSYKSGEGVSTANFSAMAAAAGMQLNTIPGGWAVPQPGGGYALNENWIKGELAANRPVIFNTNTGGVTGHYEVVVGYSPNPAGGTQYTVIDPWTGQRSTIDAQTLRDNISRGNGYLASVMRQP